MFVSTSYQLICGCTLLGYVLGGHVFGNSVLDRQRIDAATKRQTLICNNHCAFGFLSDFEGALTCQCYDPCSYVLCLQGAVCIAEMPRDCLLEPCKAKTRCEMKAEVVSKTKQKDHEGQIWGEVPVGIQGDGPLWNDVTDDVNDTCSKPLPMEAVDCADKRKRWFYNSMTGKCEKFEGCPTAGNNFARKRYCKEQCRYRLMKKNNRKASKSSSQDDAVCFEPLSHNAKHCNIEDQTKRWHYNAQTGKCEKFFGCPTAGNNFSRKIACKSKCLRKRTYTRFFKDAYSHSKNSR